MAGDSHCERLAANGISGLDVELGFDTAVIVSPYRSTRDLLRGRVFDIE
jgi:hypothetical protein